MKPYKIIMEDANGRLYIDEVQGSNQTFTIEGIDCFFHITNFGEDTDLFNVCDIQTGTLLGNHVFEDWAKEKATKNLKEYSLFYTVHVERIKSLGFELPLNK